MNYNERESYSGNFKTEDEAIAYIEAKREVMEQNGLTVTSLNYGFGNGWVSASIYGQITGDSIYVDDEDEDEII